jgi:PKD repeat protein
MRSSMSPGRVARLSFRPSAAPRRVPWRGFMLAAALFAGAAVPAAGAASLAGVHWYSGDSTMLDLSAPAGERGYDVEVIFDAGWCDGNPSTDPGDVRAVAATARAHGLVNVVRVDYHQLQAVPTSSGEYAAWATSFIKCTQELGDLASLFIVGNEPNIEDGGRPEGDIRADEYANAFNYLYSRKVEMPPGTQLLATFNSPFTPPGWMLDMSSRLSGVDGFALHTGGVRPACRDPRQPCAYGGWPFDGAFRYYRDVIGSIHSSWWSRPVYVTEFNTYTGDPGSEPDVNYPADWINQAFEEIRNYNASRGTKPEVKALCWFVDRPQSWPRFSLRNIGAARTDMGEEFKNPANRGAGGSCANDALAVPTDRWKLEIWNNRDLAGTTVEQRYDAAGGGGFSFDWASGRPSTCVANDDFGVRFTRKAHFPTSGSYTFTARTDDGVRLFVDGTLVVDDWRDMAPTDHTATVSLAAGWHDLRMDYYENAGGAVATLSWTGGGTAPANVARTAVAWAASSVYSAAYGGDKAYDGTVSVASKWTSNGTTADSWLALDLGRSYDVTQFVVKHAGSAGESKGYNTQAFRLESGTSLSGPWTTRATVANTAQTDDASTVTLTGPVVTRYVRLYVTDAGIDNYARIPEFEVYGTPTAVPPSPGMLTNGDFESSTPGSPVGAGWTAFSSAGYASTFAVVSAPDPVHGGSYAQRVTSPQPTSNDKFGGVYQVVGTTAGLQYTVRAWNRTHFTGGQTWDHIARLGIDLAGGTGFEAPSVQWAEFDSAKDAWHPLEVVVTATGASMTVYLESWRKWASGGDSQAWFDDVQVVQGTPPPANHPPTAVATANPASGPAPLSVAFSGTGSSDPDGDALTYAWSFGDGTTGTGATVSHTYSAAGSYTATLTVSDGHGGSNSANVAITALAAASPLVNGDFESSTPGSALGTGWVAFSSSGYAPTFAVVSPPDPVHGGSFAQRVTSPQPRTNDMFAGVYQVVATTPGVQYTVRAWSRTHFTGGVAWDHIARLGIDLAGGNDFQAGSVQWFEFDSAKDGWHPLEEVVTASGASMTIYLESWRKWASGGDSLTWFDDVQAGPSGSPPTNHPPTAVATAAPTSGPAPLAVAFSGAGSSDPDGDPLTYAWSFGDGAQGSGVSVSHNYPTAGTYAATLTVNDGRGGTHSAEVLIVVDPPSGNRPPVAAISANPKSATIPFTVTLDGRGSSDPDGDPLTYSWSFADGVRGSGPTMQRTFEDANGDMKEAGGYLVTLTVSDGRGGTASASVRIGAFPPGCPASLDFDAIRAQLAAQGQDLAFVKVGFHTGGGGTFPGLGLWERCLDAAGVPFTLKQVPSANNGSVGEVAGLRARSGVPHTAIYRRCCEDFELPPCAVGGDWNNCTDDIAQQEAHAHWLRHLQAFPREVTDNKQWVWVETINEPWKGSGTRNNAEWLAKFSYYTAQETLAAGYSYAAFGWSSGEPEVGPPPDAMSPGYQWDGPEMQRFLRLAAQYPDRIAVSLHEYNYGDPTLKSTYPSLVGRFEKLLARCDANGIRRPTVLITEFGWPAPPSAGEVMAPDNVPWAAGLYAGYPQVEGVALWDQGGMGPIISRMTAYALQSYFAIPRSSRSTGVRRPPGFVTAAGRGQP